ncbi:MAG: S-methyl-5'-thioadenosine phosphorylase [Chloroflexi bacterium]|nr:MAG: S-methyl-5'-thioadenosine phosphorylase [Phototrophicales bacterium]RMF79118.1 MAG: S-methyl-5'-thioadenosine phosphorylase [Chloroflexota bacterium]
MSEQVQIGVIGGSGLYNMSEITNKSTLSVDTPYGQPSADIVLGELRGKRVAFLPRHGVGHVHTPSDVPYRANIFALKALGVRYIIGVNACGSLREDYEPGHIVIPDQLVDFTHHRARTFFEAGLVAHVSVADPFCHELRALFTTAVQHAGGTVHASGNFLVEEGPRFATRGESRIFQQWGCDIVGMTTCPEAFLAREAEIAYAAMAHVTDYDVWHTSEAPVTVEMVVATMQRNLEIAQQAIAYVVEHLDEGTTCSCHTALDDAIMTAPDTIDPTIREKLAPIVNRYFSKHGV